MTTIKTTWPDIKNTLFWLFLIGLVMLPRLLNLDTFVGPDELAELGRDNRFALTLERGELSATLVGDGKPSVTLMWVNTIGVGLKWLWLKISDANLTFVEAIAPERPFSLWPERRMFLALASGLQILLAWPLLRVVWNRQVATAAVVLMAIEPFMLAFTRMIRGDSLVAGFMLLSVLSALAFVKTNQQRYNWLAGAMGGLTLLTKSSGSIIVPTVMAIYVVVAFNRYTWRNRQGWRWLIGSVIGWGVSLAIIFFGLWPAWWFRPVETFNLVWGKMAFHAAEAAETRAGTYFWGTTWPHGPGPWFYPVLALLRLTPWLLLGGFVAVTRWLRQAIRLRSITVEPYTLAIIFYVVMYWLTITIPDQKIDRFFVPIIPGLAVLTAIKIANIANWLKCKRPSVWQSGWLRLTTVTIALLLIAHISFYHPLYSTYFNPLIGEHQFWQWALPIGHGEGVDEALIHLSTQSNVSDKILVCGTNFPRCQPFFAGKIWHQKDLRSTRWFEADYVLWHVDEQQMELFSPEVLNYLRRQSQIYVANYHGINYTWLYALPQPDFLTQGSKLEGIATLLGYDIKGEKSLNTLSPGDQLPLHLYWQNEGQAAEQRFWWRIVDDKGYVWSEAEVNPLPEFETDAAKDEAIVEGEVILSVPPDIPPNIYYLKAGFANPKGDAGEFALPAEGSLFKVKGASVEATPPTNELNQSLTPNITLQGYDLSSTKGIPGEIIWLVLHWQTVEQPQQDYVIKLRLRNETGEEMGSWSGLPVYNTYPTHQWSNQANVRDPWPLSLPPDLSLGQYQLSLDLFDSFEKPLAQIDLGTITIVQRKASFDIPPMQFEVNQSFDQIATLLGYDLLGNLSPDGARVQLTLYWQAMQATSQPYRVSIRLVDTTGAVLAEHEAGPATGVAPTTEWQAGEIIIDVHELEIIGNEPKSVNMEIRLIDAAGQSISLSNSAESYTVSNVQEKVMWRTLSP